MVRVVQMDEAVLEELEEQGGLSKTTINNHKNFLAAFKQWVMENTGKGLVGGVVHYSCWKRGVHQNIFKVKDFVQKWLPNTKLPRPNPALIVCPP